MVLDAPRAGRTRTSIMNANLEMVTLYFIEQSITSLRLAAGELDISKSSFHRIMKTLRFKPYRPRLLYHLNNIDFDC